MRVYDENYIDFVDNVNGETFSVMDMNKMLRKLGYVDEEDGIMAYIQ